MQRDMPIVDETDPVEAWNALSGTAQAALIDVRTRAEWSFVGIPDLSGIAAPLWLVEWVGFPDMSRNPSFCEQIAGEMGEDGPDRLIFICRSGQRSMAAAIEVARHFSERGRPLHCTNVSEGFEGPLGQDRRRGTVGGWKARGLPWQQS